MDTRPPGTRREPTPGVFVYDIGQNLTGWAEISVKAPAGTAVEVFYSEKLGDDGKASTVGNDLVFGQLQTDYYVASGKGFEHWAPRFSYKGFQYVQVSAPKGEPLPADVTVAVERIHQVRSDLRRTSTFESGNETLNRIHRNATWAVQSNLHGIITDTPVYEKNAWTGDAQLTSGTASLLFDTERLYRKMFQDMLDAQKESGEVPLLAPSNQNYGYVGKPAFKPVDCCGATPAWDAFWFVIPWESYVRYGNRAALEVTYPAMQKYLDLWLPQWTGKDGDAYAHTLTSGLGDWVPPQGVPTINAIVSTAYYAHLARIAADAARALGRPEDAARYDRLFASIRSDFNARFLTPEGIYREKDSDPFVQTAQILPLAFGLVPDDRRAALATRLADDIVNARGGHAYVGVIGARYVLPVLTETGHHDVAYAVATQTDRAELGLLDGRGRIHGAGRALARHHALAQPPFLRRHRAVALRRPRGPAAFGARLRAILFKPEIPRTGLDHVKASYESVRGTVATRWQRTAAGLELDVTVPANATAEVHIPASGPDVVSEGGRAAASADRRPIPAHGRRLRRVCRRLGPSTTSCRSARFRDDECVAQRGVAASRLRRRSPAPGAPSGAPRRLRLSRRRRGRRGHAARELPRLRGPDLPPAPRRRARRVRPEYARPGPSPCRCPSCWLRSATAVSCIRAARWRRRGRRDEQARPTSSRPSRAQARRREGRLRGPVLYQLYLMGGRRRGARRPSSAPAWPGSPALVVTIDTAVAGIRERDHRNGDEGAGQGPGLLAKVPYLPEILSHPGWLVGFLRDGGDPAASERRDPGPGSDAAARRRRRPGQLDR